MAKKKIQKVMSKDQKRLLISLLLGDGTISSNYVFKLSHSSEQKEFLEWKVNLLNKYNIKNNGIKEYISTCGYNIGKLVLYSQMSLTSTIKALRRSVYTPKKTITRNLLNWLDRRGIAIWYMDDGCINVNTSKQRTSICHRIRISTCVDENTVQVIIKYFKEVWDIEFHPFHEGKNTFSIYTTDEKNCKKFVDIVKPYILEVPSLLYKIRNNYTKEEFISMQKEGSKIRDILL